MEMGTQFLNGVKNIQIYFNVLCYNLYHTIISTTCEYNKNILIFLKYIFGDRVYK